MKKIIISLLLTIAMLSILNCGGEQVNEETTAQIHDFCKNLLSICVSNTYSEDECVADFTNDLLPILEENDIQITVLTDEIIGKPNCDAIVNDMVQTFMSNIQNKPEEE